jgi:hypothetical protein
VHIHASRCISVIVKGCRPKAATAATERFTSAVQIAAVPSTYGGIFAKLSGVFRLRTTTRSKPPQLQMFER